MGRLAELLLRFALLLVAPLPRRHRRRLLGLFIESEEVRGGDEEALRFLLGVDDDLSRAISRAAVTYGQGVHPKHELTGYHRFFVDNIGSGEKILDVGCGLGEVAADISSRYPACEVTGVDILPELIEKARSAHCRPNLRFECMDVLKQLPVGGFDVVVLSNVLEHISPRKQFLGRLRQETKAVRFLVRVPLFERHWAVAMRKRLGMPFYCDPTHEIEYTRESLIAELRQAHLTPTHEEYRWGEAWVVAEPGERS